MSSTGSRKALAAPDFGPLAESYDRLRPQDANWHRLLDVLVEAGDLVGRRVLDVGCGTGALARALAERGARVWGIDPSLEMLAVARANGDRAVGLKRGTAEQLPFKDGWFEGAVLRLVVHLVDRGSAFPELARVLASGGRAVLATFDPDSFGDVWLTRFFPSAERIDRARFPAPDILATELESAGFARVRVRRITQTYTVDRAEALARIRGRYISTLRLLPEGELAEGTAQAEAELSDMTNAELHWIVLVAEQT